MSKPEGCTEAEPLYQILFGHENTRLRNIKFCRGTNDVVEPAEIAASVHASLLAARSGQIKGLDVFPDVEREPIDVVEFVKNL